jgi:hypothetical protein
MESAGRLHRLSRTRTLTICPRAEDLVAAILTQKGKALNVSFSCSAYGVREEHENSSEFLDNRERVA